MIKNSFRRLFGTALVGLSLAANAADPKATAAASPEFSEAETVLWMTDQLKSVTKPVVLTYQFEKSGSFESGFKDSVVFTVHKVKSDGMKAASLAFFSGERNFPVPPEDSTNVNPTLKVYFQGDVYEMNRLSDPDGGARERWRYFQRRIKLALAEAATVTPTKFEFDGRQYAGKAIVFQPFATDPKRKEFEKFADKTYRVIVSDELPGYLYQIETVVPDKNLASVPLIHESLQLTSVTPDGGHNQ